ncbi:hypothetical protein J3458_021845 [Metarhizium acridum]|uniref:uncharacterized protein n=1 Tax=Metarhizium acridum TaxID=92637 RepID=UPI001C6AB104|nr:hypothetical protein J3458_021845 [Metarhizium acridum]
MVSQVEDDRKRDRGRLGRSHVKSALKCKGIYGRSLHGSSKKKYINISRLFPFIASWLGDKQSTGKRRWRFKYRPAPSLRDQTHFVVCYFIHLISLWFAALGAD